MGVELQKYGHRVRLATHNVFKDFVRNAGLEFYPIGGDPASLMSYMVRNPGLIPSMKTLREGEIKAKRKMVSEMLLGCWKSCISPDPDTDAPFVANAIIANPPSFAHIHCAQSLSIPLHMVFTMPWSPTRAFPHPLANVRNNTVGEGMANYLSFGLVSTLTWQGLGDIINKFREDVLGLEAVPATEGPFLAETLQIPHTYCWSPGLVPKPKDWSDRIDVTGFIFRSTPAYTPPDNLARFLQAGPAPVYIGFGSIVVERPEVLLQTILQAVELSGTRCIISKGWSSLATNEIPDNVFFVGDCPHEWLFQQTSAVVHHGGAGTTAAGLLAGKPTVIVPFFGDQPFWGDMVASAGAGPPPIPHKTLNAANLSKAIEFCKTPEASAAAKAVAVRMAQEDGVTAAVESFHRHLDPEKMRCDLIPTLPALFPSTKRRSTNRFKLQYESKTVKISGLAAEILTKAEKIREKDLKLYEVQPFIIENRRWDPITAITSEFTGLAVNVASTTNDLWYSPYKVYSRHQKSTSSATSIKSNTSDPPAISPETSKKPQKKEKKEERRREKEKDEAPTETQSQQPEQQILRNTLRKPNPNARAAAPKPPSLLSSSDNPPQTSSSNSPSQTSSSSSAPTSLHYAASSAIQIPKLLGHLSKSLITLPNALTEGLRATPALYHDTPKPHRPITDWKSGFYVAGTDFATGVSSGLSDLVVQPMKGLKEKNPTKGFIKGVGKGAVGTLTKTGYGMVGLYSHSAMGIYRSVHGETVGRGKGGRSGEVGVARRVQGFWAAREGGEGTGVDEEGVVRAFEAL